MRGVAFVLLAACTNETPIGPIDFEEFEDLLKTVAAVADEWDDRLAELFPGES